MIHDDGTMDVMVGGNVERRKVAWLDKMTLEDGTEIPVQYWPEATDAEIVMHPMGEIPRIIPARL